jgi:hypothetical protein
MIQEVIIVLGSNSQGLLGPEHKKNVKVGRCALESNGNEQHNGRVINVSDLSLGESPGGLFIGAIRGR